MAEPIQHNGAWWHQQPDGSWLRWNETSQAWEPWAGGMGVQQAAAVAPQPVQHNGAWWQQRPDGSWLRWNDGTQAWEPWTGGAQPAAGAQPAGDAPAARAGSDDVFDQIRKLAELKDQGILSEEEFASKKQALLDKLG